MVCVSDRKENVGLPLYDEKWSTTLCWVDICTHLDPINCVCIKGKKKNNVKVLLSIPLSL